MSKDNAQDQTSKNESRIVLILKEIELILKNGAAWIGLTAIFVGLLLDIKISNKNIEDSISELVSSFLITGGTTLLSVALINLIYERWHDKKIEAQIQSIPESVKTKIESSIVQISENVSSKFNPCVPCKIFHPGYQEKDPIADYIKRSLENSDGKYYYTGIGMTTMAGLIGRMPDKLKEAYFLIPNPQYKGLTNEDRRNMATSIDKIIKTWNCQNQMKVEFVLLDHIPSFHIHKTSSDCWFAFLDKGVHGMQERQKYPATYQYRKNQDKSDDNYEMYHTIADTINKLYSRHSSGTSCKRYIFMQGQITCQIGNKPTKEIEEKDFIKLFRS